MEKYIKPISRTIIIDQIQLLNTSVSYKGDYSGSVIIGAKRNDDDSSEWDEEE